MKSYSHVLFDLDGTLTDPKTGITSCVAYALDSFGIHVDNLDTLTPFIGPPLKDSFMEFYKFTEDMAEKAAAKYRERFSKTGLYENTVYPGIEELLKDLKASGRHLYIATSKPYVFASKILTHFGLISYFEYIAGSELDNSRSKKGEVIAYALKENRITDKSQVLMIGDRKHDILGAKENGIDSMGVLFGYGDRQEHELAKADYILNSVQEIRAFFGLQA